MTIKTHNPHTTTLLGFICMVLIWGSFPVVAKIGVENAPPLMLSSIRFLLAGGVMAIAASLQRKRMWIKLRQHWQIFIVSLFMVGIPSCVFFAAAPYASIGVLTLMWATSPIFTSICNVGGTGEVRGWRLLVSLVIGAIGILVVLTGGIPFLTGTFVFASRGSALIAELAVLASAAVYGFGMWLAKRNNNDVPVTVFTGWQVFYTGVFVGIISLFVERGQVFHVTLTTASVLLYLVIFCSCISFFLTFWLIRRIGAIRTSYSDFIIPGVTLLLSYLFLGESLTLAKVGGFVLVMVGCVLVEM